MSAGRAAAVDALKQEEKGGGEESMEASARRTFRFGFHAVPSMAQLHLHVVSQDLRGSGMKHRKHWNSFATDFFRDASVGPRHLFSFSS